MAAFFMRILTAGIEWVYMEIRSSCI